MGGGAAPAVVLAFLAAAGAAGPLAGCRAPRPAPNGLSVAGLPGLSRVDEGVYRSAQPTAGGFAEARRLGVRTVLSLRAEHDDARALRGSGLVSARVGMRQWHVDEEGIAASLRVLADPGLRPVLVHCQAGRDRTGLVVAAYRVVVGGWSREAAVAEMRAHGNHPLWANQRRWVARFDVGRMREKMSRVPVPELTPHGAAVPAARPYPPLDPCPP